MTAVPDLKAAGHVSLRSALRVVTGTLLFAGPVLVSLAVIFTEGVSALIRVTAISMTGVSLALMVMAHLALRATA